MDRFAAVCEDVARHSGRLAKLAAVAGYLRSLETDEDLARAVRFFSAEPLEACGLAIGGATLRDAALPVCGIGVELFRICSREVGDTAETIALLLHGRTRGEPLALADAEAIYEELSRAKRTADKQAVLAGALRSHRPTTLKYFLKVITGNLRIGLQERLLEEAVAQATGSAPQIIREAANRSGDLAAVAVAARRGTLHEIEARLFHPMDFMLAQPLHKLEDLANPGEWWIEDKYDGIRAQAHVAHGKVKLFSRGMEEIGAAFPEVILALAQLRETVVLDGELLAWRDGRALKFNALQQRLARKKVTAALLEEVPVTMVVYDLLYARDRLLLDRSFEERRARLEQLLSGVSSSRLLVSPCQSTLTHAEIDAMFAQARERGNEGLLLKRRGSAYEAGRRGGAWLKLKRPFATLDVVVTAAEQGHGRRATVLSDYTFAVRDGDAFLNIGRAYSGLTDAEVRELTRVFRGLAVERFGRVMLVRPEVVLEVAFDGIQKSPRHKSGFAMRFPRIVRWRRDKRVDEIDSIERVRQLYDASL